jgi:hypothetical protein
LTESLEHVKIANIVLEKQKISGMRSWCSDPLRFNYAIS